MANLKDITQLPVAESADGLNLIVNDNGAAKQIAASAVGAQADFSVTDETSPAFIKNKPEVVQANWNQNNTAAADYVKNRPFWTDDPVETVFVEETKLTLVNGDAELPVQMLLELGQTYSVTYNGTVYECIAWYHNGIGRTFIGNGDPIQSAEGNGEPFLTDGTFIMCMDDSVTIKIVGNIKKVHKIDSKYIDYPKAFSVITGYNEETDEVITSPINTVHVVQYDNADVVDTFHRKSTVEYDGYSLLIPQEDYAYSIFIEDAIDVRNLSKGERASMRITRDTRGDQYYIKAAKGVSSSDSLYIVALRDERGSAGAIANGMRSTIAMSRNGKLCEIIVSGYNTEFDDGYVEIIVEVLGTIVVS